MNTYEQIVQPRLDTVSGAGWCLNFAQKFFGTPHLYASAWEAYLDTVRKQTGALPTGAAVVLWFEHWGTYQGKYANWGHVAIHVPGRGIYTSPWYSNYGQEIYQSIGEIERIFHARYVGWTDNISGVEVARKTSSKKEDIMSYVTLYRTPDNAGSNQPTKPSKGTQKVPGGQRTLLKWNASETYCVQGPLVIGATSASVTIKGPPGNTVSLGAVVGKWEKSRWKEKRFLDSVEQVIPPSGTLKFQLTTSNVLSKGERLYFYVFPQKSPDDYIVSRYTVKGFSQKPAK